MAAPFALIVEDNADLAALYTRALQDAGYKTEAVASGHEAQARLVFTNPDLILLDLYLPRSAGDVVLRQLAGQPRFAHCKVVIVTGDENAAQAHASEVERVLVKPVGYEQLRELASEWLSVESRA